LVDAILVFLNQDNNQTNSQGQATN